MLSDLAGSLTNELSWLFELMVFLNLLLFEKACQESAFSTPVKAIAQLILCNVKSQVRTNSISTHQRYNTERESLLLLYIGWVLATCNTCVRLQSTPESQFLVEQLIVGWFYFTFIFFVLLLLLFLACLLISPFKIMLLLSLFWFLYVFLGGFFFFFHFFVFLCRRKCSFHFIVTRGYIEMKTVCDREVSL